MIPPLWFFFWRFSYDFLSTHRKDLIQTALFFFWHVDSNATVTRETIFFQKNHDTPPLVFELTNYNQPDHVSNQAWSPLIGGPISLIRSPIEVRSPLIGGPISLIRSPSRSDHLWSEVRLAWSPLIGGPISLIRSPSRSDHLWSEVRSAWSGVHLGRSPLIGGPITSDLGSDQPDHLSLIVGLLRTKYSKFFFLSTHRRDFI